MFKATRNTINGGRGFQRPSSMKKALFAIAGLAIAGTTVIAPTANANSSGTANQSLNVASGALAGVFGPALVVPINPCSTTNLVPLLATNYTNQPQTASFDIPEGLTEQVQLGDDVIDGSGQCPGGMNRDGTGAYQQNSPEFEATQVVAPGETVAIWLSMGGVDFNLGSYDKSFYISGMPPEGTAASNWGVPQPDYGFALNLNGDGGFINLQSYYENTGGTGSSNTQNGFNIVQCSPETLPTSGSAQVGTTLNILSPYAGVNSSAYGDTNGPKYVANQPICLAWIPTGSWTGPAENTSGDNNPIVSEVIYSTNTPNPGGTATTLLELGGPVNSVQVVGVDGIPVLLPTTPGGPNGFWAQSGWQVYITGIPSWSTTEILVTGTDGSQSVVSFPGTGAPDAPAPVNSPLSSLPAIDPNETIDGYNWSVTDLMTQQNGPPLSSIPEYHVTLNSVGATGATVTMEVNLPPLQDPSATYLIWGVCQAPAGFPNFTCDTKIHQFNSNFAVPATGGVAVFSLNISDGVLSDLAEIGSNHVMFLFRAGETSSYTSLNVQFTLTATPSGT